MIQRVQLSLLSNSTVIHNSQHVLLRLLCIFGTVVLWYCASVVLCSLDRLCSTTLLLLDVECLLSMFLCSALHCSENRQQSCMFNTALCCVQRVFMHLSYVTVPVC
jgi:hypothetical protein